jgi:hypothetical protein
MDTVTSRATFQMRFGALPAVRENVELVVGLFADRSPHLADVHPGPIALLKTIFRYLDHKITRGRIIKFDEYFIYPGWQHYGLKHILE